MYLLIGSCFIYGQTKNELIKVSLGDGTISLERTNNENDLVLLLKKDGKILDKYNVYAMNPENLDIQLIDLDSDQIKEVILYIDSDGGSSSYSYDTYMFFKIIDNKLKLIGSADTPQSNKKSLKFEKGIITIPFLRFDYESTADTLADEGIGLFSDVRLTRNYKVINKKLITLPTIIKDNKNLIIHSKVENNIPYISVKDIATVLGYKVEFNNKTKTMNISNNTSISLNTKKAKIKTNTIELKYLPKNFLNTIMISLEDFSTLFNMYTYYSKGSNVIIIDSSRQPMKTTKTYKENLKKGIIPELEYILGDDMNKVTSLYGKPTKTYTAAHMLKVSEYEDNKPHILHNNNRVIGVLSSKNTLYGVSIGSSLKYVKTILGTPDSEYSSEESAFELLMPHNAKYSTNYYQGETTLQIYYDENFKVIDIQVINLSLAKEY